MTEHYRKYFEDMNLERCAVFDVLQQWSGGATVLYPGSFIHITPSFYFQHVVYVDRSSLAAQCFADIPGVQALVNRRKYYRQAPYIRFLAQDYTAALPLREASFSLLISLYAGAISQSCGRYLKSGGFLLCDNHHDDAGEAFRSGRYELVAIMHYKGRMCQLVETDLAGYFVPRQQGRSGSYIQYGSNCPTYTRNADYYVFKRTSAAASH